MTNVDLDALADRIAARVVERMPDSRPLLSPAQVAERLGMSERKARELLGDGVIPSLKIGGSRKVEASAVDAYIEQRKSDAA